jgi:uncharacterized protein with PIN domain
MRDTSQIIKMIKETEDALSVSVKISHDERDRLVVERLIGIRNFIGNRKDVKLIQDIDNVIRFWLNEDEFQKYVINKEPLE